MRILYTVFRNGHVLGLITDSRQLIILIIAYGVINHFNKQVNVVELLSGKIKVEFYFYQNKCYNKPVKDYKNRSPMNIALKYIQFTQHNVFRVLNREFLFVYIFRVSYNNAHLAIIDQVSMNPYKCILWDENNHASKSRIG